MTKRNPNLELKEITAMEKIKAIWVMIEILIELTDQISKMN